MAKTIQKKTPLLTKAQQKRITKLGDHWQLDAKQKKLTGVFGFKRYLDAFMFATRVSVHAEVQNHHPEICISEDGVKVTLTTRSLGAVGEKDVALAERIEQILSTRRTIQN